MPRVNGTSPTKATTTHLRSVRRMTTRSSSNRSTRSSGRATELTKHSVTGKRGNQSSTNSSSSSISNSTSSSSSSSSSNSSSSCGASIAPYEWTCELLTDEFRRMHTHSRGQPVTLPTLVPGQYISVCTSFICPSPPYWRRVQIAEILPKDSITHSPLVIPVGLPYPLCGRSLTSKTDISIPGIPKQR